MAHETTQEEKNRGSSEDPPRAKPIPSCLVRTNWQAQLAVRGRTEDAGFLLTIEAGRKLSPERFFRLLVEVMRER